MIFITLNLNKMLKINKKHKLSKNIETQKPLKI